VVAAAAVVPARLPMEALAAQAATMEPVAVAVAQAIALAGLLAASAALARQASSSSWSGEHGQRLLHRRNSRD